MSQLDPFPGDDKRIVRELERRIEQLEAAVKGRPAAAVTRASSPFFLPNGTVPNQSGGLTVGVAADGGFRVVDSVGNAIQLPVSNVSTITATNAGASYDATAQTLINQLKTSFNDLTFALKIDRVMKSS